MLRNPSQTFLVGTEPAWRESAEPAASHGAVSQGQVRRVSSVDRNRKHRAQSQQAQESQSGAADGPGHVELGATHHRADQGRARPRLLHT